MSVVRKAEIFNSNAIFVEGIGFIANSVTAELPAIEFESFESKSGLAYHNVPTTVLKKMTAKFEINEVNTVYFEALLKRRNEKAVFWLKSHSYVNSSKDRKIVVTLKGAISKYEFPKQELGKEAKSTLSLDVDFFKYEQDGVVQCLIDIDNLICELNGTDLWSVAREAILG